MSISEAALNGVADRSSLFAFLHEQLGWPVDPEDTFTYEGPRLPREIADRVAVSQIVPFTTGDPFTILLAEFETPFRRSDLRQILRRVLAEARTIGKYNSRKMEDVIIIVAARSYSEVRFARFEERLARTPRLSSFGWRPGNIEGERTLRSLNLPFLSMPSRNLLGEIEWQHARWVDAWNVEKVTEQFFSQYQEIFSHLILAIEGVTGDRRLFAQRLCNRLMFIQFLAKKRWLNRDLGYLRSIYQTARDAAVIPGVKISSRANFYSDYLWPLFFQGLNTPDSERPSDPEWSDLSASLGDIPFLNGGLFAPHDADDLRGAVRISNDAFAPLLDLFDHFNFTLTESTPDDVEVAVDPEMLGKVFEELVTEDERHGTGSYYTPRNVVAFMCREALKGYLSGIGLQGDLARFVDKGHASALADPEAVLEALKSVSVCDPACGSGAYLLGMMQELLRLRGALFTSKVKDHGRVYDRKLEIIQRNLYGVDKEPFAVNIAMLRLWLALVVDDERNPLDDPTADVSLPNLKFKIQQGDALIASIPDSQSINLFGGAFLSDAHHLRSLHDEYFSRPLPGKTPRSKTEIETEIAVQQERIGSLVGSQAPEGAVDWCVRFAEVFAPRTNSFKRPGTLEPGVEIGQVDRVGGFDIVLANPPYVRQEEIGPTKPLLLSQFGQVAQGNSDLFVYFYARGLELLRPGGMHVFVCSNSWLDVGYGGRLQKYLLTNSDVQAIYESAVERQFATADINTIISVIRKGKPSPSSTTQFVSFRAPFDEAIADRSLARQVSRSRSQLWEAGLGDPDSRGVRSFEGDKWGGKYLRAPSIYWRILDKAGDRLCCLKALADVRFGIKTGANDFFYVRVISIDGDIATIRCDDGSEHLLEAQFVREPVLVKAREVTRPKIDSSDLVYRLVRLDDTAPGFQYAAKYIRWGEEKEFHQRPTLRNRRYWFALNLQEAAAVAFPMAHKRRAVIADVGQNQIHIDNRFYGVFPYPDYSRAGTLMAASLLSTFSTLCREVHGRANFGQGVLDMKVYEVKGLPVVHPNKIHGKEQLTSAFDQLSGREIRMIYDELRRTDRRALDDAFLLAVGFTDATKRADVLAELHDSTCRSVWDRQAKAQRTRESRQTYDEWLATGLPFGGVEQD